MSRELDLDGRVAVVTGAAQGQGLASATALAARGATVALLDIDADTVKATAAAIGDGATGFACDVTSEASVRDCFASINRDLGPVRILHNNAGVMFGYGEGDGPAAELSLDVWNQTLAVNLTGPFLCVKYALPSMLTLKSGSIINTSSVVGTTIGTVNTAYASSKAGVVGLTKSIVISYAGTGVRANAICPGPIRTRMSAKMMANEAQFERYVAGLPSGRIGEPEDIGELVAFLASDASSYLNGVILPIDGGLISY